MSNPVGPAPIMNSNGGSGTHLAYKPEHAMDLDTGAMVAAEVQPPTRATPRPCRARWPVPPSISRRLTRPRRHEARRAVYNNRTRLLSGVARQALKLRAELVERGFALTWIAAACEGFGDAAEYPGPDFVWPGDHPQRPVRVFDMLDTRRHSAGSLAGMGGTRSRALLLALAVMAATLVGVIAFELHEGALDEAPVSVTPARQQSEVPPASGSNDVSPEKLAEHAATILARPLFSPSRRPPIVVAPSATSNPLARLTGVIMSSAGKNATSPAPRTGNQLSSGKAIVLVSM